MARTNQQVGRLSRIWRSLISGVQKAWRSTVDGILAIWRFFVVCIRGTEQEEPKLVLHRTWAHAVLKCWIHLPPTMAIAVLAYFNFPGYFIGAELSGSTQPVLQDFYRLCLQVTAKLVELLVIASLGVIVMDGVRDKLLFGSEGLPLGLLFAKARFVDITYLLSSDFRAGCLGFRNIWARVAFGVLLVLASLIALFAGPSAAVLMIPSVYLSWPAGGADFWLNGDLFPVKYDIDLVRNGTCTAVFTNTTLLHSTDWKYADCPWAGFPFLKDYFSQKFLGSTGTLSYEYGTFRQTLNVTTSYGRYSTDQMRTWAIASNMVLGAFSRVIAEKWHLAIVNTKTSSPRLRNLQSSNDTTLKVQSLIPLVRTQCFIDPFSYLDGSPGPPPDFSPHHASQGYLPFPSTSDMILCNESLFRENGCSDVDRFFVQVGYLNVTGLATQWIAIPDGPTLTSPNSFAKRYPTALLLIQNYPISVNVTQTVTCSIEADWVSGANLGLNIGHGSNHFTTQAASAFWSDQSKIWDWNSGIAGTPLASQSILKSDWKHITLTTDWLNWLTPAVGGSAGRTSIASIMEILTSPQSIHDSVSFTYGNDPSHTYRKLLANQQVQEVVSSFVLDGITRVGWQDNHASNLTEWNTQQYYPYPYHSGLHIPGRGWFFGWTKSSTFWTAILQGTSVLEPRSAYRQSEGRTFRGDMYVSGYGLKANGPTGYLAFTVFFTYLVLVVMHVAYTFWRTRTSDSWSSLTDLFLLSQSSTPPQGVAGNTCAGAEDHKTLKLQVRIREQLNSPVGSEVLQLLLDKDEGSEVKDKTRYGAKT